MEQATQEKTPPTGAGTKPETETARKYRLTDECIEHEGFKLFRIQALIDFGNFEAGDLGGFIETEDHLDQAGAAWVMGDAKVYNRARVFDDAIVAGNAEVHGDACISGNAVIRDHAIIGDNALVQGFAEIRDKAQIRGHASVGEFATVSDTAKVFGEVYIYGEACICDNASIYGNARIFGRARVFDNACVSGTSSTVGAMVYDGAKVEGDTHLDTYAQIRGKADIYSDNDFFTIHKMGSHRATLTAFKQSDGTIGVSRGCFFGTLDEFEEAVIKEHGNNSYAQEYLLAIPLIKKRLG